MAIGVVGLGYVGLPLVVAFAQAGENVIAVDVDQRKIDAARARASPTSRTSPPSVLRAVLPQIHATTRLRAAGARRGGADLRADAADRQPRAGPAARCRPLAGAGRGRPARPADRARVDDLPGHHPRAAGARAGGPVRPDGRRRTSTSPSPPSGSTRAAPTSRCKNTPKVVGGITDACAERAAELYGRVCDAVIRVSTPEAAEMTKLLENIFRSVNIALVNELSIARRPHGHRHLGGRRRRRDQAVRVHAVRARPGMGGHCLPVDPFYLTWRAREFHMSTEFIELAGKINQQMPLPLRRADRAGAQRRLQADPGSKIAILGVAYKGGIGDIRESPALRIIEELTRPRRGPGLPRPVRPRADRSSGSSAAQLDDALDGRRRGRAGDRPPWHRSPGDRPGCRAVRGPARRHPRGHERQPRPPVVAFALVAGRASGFPGLDRIFPTRPLWSVSSDPRADARPGRD